MKYNYILFDLDGTITDPKVGITKSAQYALKKRNILVDDLNTLEKFIGPPLKDSFMEFYDFSEEESINAIDDFREYFKDKGIFENIPYEGIKEMLENLKSNKKILAISTSKPTFFAKKILDHFKLSDYFDVIVGSNLDNTRTDKSEVIEETLRQLGITNNESILMIGDRKHDLIGARKQGVESIGVSYGYGSVEELKNESPIYIAKSVSLLSEKLLGI